MKQLSPFPSLHIIYSQRVDGSFRNLEAVKNALASKISHPIAYMKVEHGVQIATIDVNGVQEVIGDTILTSVSNQVITLVVGDCFPVILYDPQNKMLALVHCGWRSLAQNIIAKTIDEMHNTYQTEPSNVQVWIGPGICAKHYTQSEPPEQLNIEGWKDCVKLDESEEFSIDLAFFIRKECERLGVKEQSIIDEDKCTYLERDEFFSHRRATETGDEDGRFFIAVWQT